MVDDASDYGKGLADDRRQGPRRRGRRIPTPSRPGQTDFSATVTKVKASGADAVFYGGYYAEAGLLVKQLRAGGYKGTVRRR